MRIRLIRSFSLVALAAILAVVVFVRLDTQRQVENYMFRGGMVGAENLVNALETYHAQTGSWQGAEEILSAPHASPGAGLGRMNRGGQGLMNQRLRLIDVSGSLIYDNAGEMAPGTRVEPGLINQAIQLVDSRNQTIGYLLVNGGLVFQPGDQQPLIQSLNSAALWAALLALALGLAIALVLSSRLLRPVRQLTEAAEKVAAGDLTQQVPVRGTDELAGLGRSFNTMSASLRRSEERRQAMTADIAHELRTPLTVQRAHLEALQDGIYPLTVENLQPVMDQTELLGRLVEDLRTLALADAGELHLEREPVEIAAFLRDALRPFQSQADAHNIQLQLHCDEAQARLWVQADRHRLSQILNNLLSNALRHTPDGGRIDVRANRQGERVQVEVQDSGPGISEGSLEQVFERFYRADRSRSRQEGGTGLGLAIARQLALSHGGDLIAANGPLGGAVFTLRLPAIEA